MAICQGVLGLNPGTDFGFFQLRIAVNLFLLGIGIFLKMCNRTVHSFLSCFLSSLTIVKIINFNQTVYQEKGKQSIKRPILKIYINNIKSRPNSV